MATARTSTRCGESLSVRVHANLAQSLIHVSCKSTATADSVKQKFYKIHFNAPPHFKKYKKVKSTYVMSFPYLYQLLSEVKVFQLTFGSNNSFPLLLTPVTLHQTKDCDCCSPSGVREIPVELICDDKFKLIKHFNVPSSCSCTKCGTDEAKLLKLTAAS